MRQVLLDYPWPISDSLEGGSPAWNVLRSFDNLVKAKGLDAVQFITNEELADYWRAPRQGTGSAWANIGRIAQGLVRHATGDCSATPHPEVPELSTAWRCSLREAMQDTDDWRNPQIVIPVSRSDAWPNQYEIGIHFEICAELSAEGPYARMLVRLQAYEEHPYASSDFDPWDLTHYHPVQNSQPGHLAHPCRLPKPPQLTNVPLEQLPEAMRQLNKWDGDRLFYIPPIDWRPTRIAKQDWRNGRAIPHGEVDGHRGFIDRDGTIWEWDNAERHWDVQLHPYRRTSHSGEMI